MTLIPCQREAFDIPEDIAYLNCAYQSPLSRKVVAAGEGAIKDKSHPWDTLAADFFTHPDKARGLFSRIIGGDADGVAVIPSVSYGIAAAAKNLPINKGEEILVLQDQFPSNVNSWRRLAEEKSASVRTLSRSSSTPHNGPAWTEVLLESISDQTAIVALPQCHWVDGAMVDLHAVSANARAHGAALVLDLTQSLGALPFDASAVQPDFAIAASYKWLMGPYAIGFMWVHPKWRNGTPLEESWIGRKGAEDFARLVDYQDEYDKGSRRFDMGERAQLQLMPMAIAAMEQLLDWGIDSIAETLAAKTETIAARVRDLGFRALPVGTRAGHYLGLSHDTDLPEGLVQSLTQHNVYVSVRGSSVRVTPHVYTSADDIERLIVALAQELGSE